MKRLWKLALSLAAVAALAALLVCTVFAASPITGTCGENLTWSLDRSTGILTISGTGEMEDYNDAYADETPSPWYNYRSSISTAVIENGVTSIGKYAFAHCESLTDVELPSGVTDIDDNAFYYCEGLTSVKIPDGVTGIGSFAFKSCRSMTSVELPSSVTGIGVSAFGNCYSLTAIEIPSSVTVIGDGAFAQCIGLTSITVQSGNPTYHSAGNCLIETASGTLLQGCKNSTIPADGSVIHIGDKAFFGCAGLADVEIPNSVTDIGRSAFRNCTDLTGVEIPNGVVSIGEYAFFRCEGLTDVQIPNGVTGIGNYAFAYCGSLSSITFTGTPPTTISSSTFSGVEATAYYPNIAAWTEDVRGNYGGTLTWVDYVHSHSFTNYVSDGNATCTADGTETARCDGCELTDTRTETGSALGHKYSALVVGPTCTEKGFTYHECEHCEDSYSDAWTDALGHEETSEKALVGIVHTCIACGYNYTEPYGNGWQRIGGKWYLFKNGTMLTGWQMDGGVWYYMSSSGVMQTGWQYIGGAWYYLKSSGAMATGWLYQGGTWYYLKSSGAMAIGWVKDAGTWYYFKSSGAMAAGWVKDSGIWYYFKSSGAMATGWLYQGGCWYYFKTDGAMAANTSRTIGGKVYRFNSGGVCLNP